MAEGEENAESVIEDEPMEESPAVVVLKEKISKILMGPGVNRQLIKYGSGTPVVPHQAQNYTPFPYTFRIRTSTIDDFAQTKSLPFYLQFDHLISVLWILFNKKQQKVQNLGIIQLQWALVLLRTIRYGNGDHPKDVQLSIRIIEDFLIDLYASLQQDFKNYGKILEIYGKEKRLEEFSPNYREMSSKYPKKSGTASQPMGDGEINGENNIGKFDQFDGLFADVLKNGSKATIINNLTTLKDDLNEKINVTDELLTAMVTKYGDSGK